MYERHSLKIFKPGAIAHERLLNMSDVTMVQKSVTNYNTVKD